MSKYTFNYLQGSLDEAHKEVSIDMQATNATEMKAEALKLHQELDFADVFSVYENGRTVYTEEQIGVKSE